MLSVSEVKRNIITKYLYPLAVVLTIFSVLLVVEYRYPYFFTQDDNRNYGIPVLIYNFKSLLNGEIAFYNFHQILGTPTFSAISSATLYPMQYIGSIISFILFKHYFAVIDIMSIINLIIAALGAFYLLKFLKLNNPSAFLGSVTWALNSFIVYVSDSWGIMSGIAAFLPWIIYYSLKLLENFSFKSLIILVILRVLLLSVGHPQFYIYSIMFEILTVLGIEFFKIISQQNNLKNSSKSKKIKMKKENPFKSIFVKTKYYILSYLITIITSLPFILSWWNHMQNSVSRSSSLDWNWFRERNFNILDWLQGIFYPFSNSGHTDLKNSYLNLQNLSHIGYLAIFFIIACFIIILFRNKSVVMDMRNNIIVFSILALISFLWTTGYLDFLIYRLPILNRFREPFRINYIVIFYLIIISSFGFDLIFFKSTEGKVTKQIFKSDPKILIVFCLIAINVLNFLLLYTLSPHRNFGMVADRIPLEEPLKDKINSGRIVTVGFNMFVPNQEMYPPKVFNSSLSLAQNYPTLWGLYHFSGYEPLMLKSNSEAVLGLDRPGFTPYLIDQYKGIPIDYFRKWGVKWYIVPKDIYLPDDFGLNLKFTDNIRNVYLDPKAVPFFFWEKNQSDSGITFNINSNSIDLNTNNVESDRLNINFVYNPFFNAEIDGKKTLLDRNKDNQMTLFVPEGEHIIKIKYVDPYFITGCYLTLSFIFIFVIIYVFRRVKLFHKYVGKQTVG